MIEVKNLVKQYGEFRAVNDISFTIEEGKIYGFLGPNGAGKTTLIRLLTGLNFKSEGEIILFGHNDNLQYERSTGYPKDVPWLHISSSKP
mgnify:CR=1 FL=1